MRRLGTWILLMAVIGLLTATAGSAEQPGYTYAYPPQGWYYYPDSPELIIKEADTVSDVLDAINNPERKSQLAEQWIQFSRQTIAKSLDFREQWLTLQRQQVANQQVEQQLRVEMLRMEGEIEKLRAANLKLQNENLQLQLQLKQQPGGQTPAQTTRVQNPPVQTPPVK